MNTDNGLNLKFKHGNKVDRNLIYGIQKGPYITVKIGKNGIFRPELNLRNSKLSGKVLNYGKIWKMESEKWKSGKMEYWKKLEKSYRQWGRTPLIVTLDLHFAPDFRILCPYKYTYHIRVPTRLGSYMLFTAKPRVPNLNFFVNITAAVSENSADCYTDLTTTILLKLKAAV